MRGNFLDTLDASKRGHVRDRADTLAGMLRVWAQQYPCIRTSRIPTAAVVTALALTELSLTDVMPAAQVILWVFGFDDQADECLITHAEMKRKAKLWYAIANYGPNDETCDDELTMILKGIKRELSKSPLFEPLREHWSSRLRILVEAMAQEYQYALRYNAQGASALPSLDEYVQGGLNSIGFPLWGATALILLRDSSVLGQLESIIETIRYAGAAARLYNDVRSVDREAQEKSMNSIFIVYHTMLGKDPKADNKKTWLAAKQHILHLADFYAQRSYKSIGHFETDSRQIEEVIRRVVAFHSYFYGRSNNDYHLASLADAYECLETISFESHRNGGTK
jgi:hypothetical protein